MTRDEARPFVRNSVFAAVLVGATLAVGGDLFFGGPTRHKQLLAYFGDEAALRQALGVWWLFAALLVAGLLVSHRWPAAALLLAGAGGAGHLLDSRIGPQLLDLAVPAVLVVVASGVRRRWMSAVLLAVFAGGAFLIVVGDVMLPGHKVADLRPDLADGPVPVLLVLTLAVAVGDGIRSRRHTMAVLVERAADLERDQRQRAALATAAERARISRELHDIVAHGLSVIVAQAQGAAAAQERHPERTAAALQRVIETGRESLAEMRRLLGVLRQPDTAVPELGLGAVPELVDQVRAAGLRVRLRIEGEPSRVPHPIDLSAYRIVQEALTNTLKHAGSEATVVVSLRFGADSLEVDVVDDGRGAPHGSGGHGLRGIAERVDLLGGELAAGAADGGGFAVRARLPIGAGT